MAAVALDLALGALVATDARGSAGLAWYGTGASAVILTLGLVVASSSVIQAALGLLAVLLLLRHQDRLLLAPLHAACLLVVGELAQRSIELRGQARIGPGVIGSRVSAAVLVAALGACGGALAAAAVTIAPARSVGFTVLGTVAVLAAFLPLVVLARRRGGAD